jgi:hypothetical protein
MNALSSTVGSLYVVPRLSSNKSELRGRRGNVCTKYRAGQYLAVETVANVDGAWLDFRLIHDRTTMTTALDFHNEPPSLDRVGAELRTICVDASHSSPPQG